MDRLIEFAYTASISVGEKCVIHVMNGAVMYQIDSVVKACCDFLVQQLDPSNAIGIANFAEQIGCTELHQKAREYIYMNFSQVRFWIFGRKSELFYLDLLIQIVLVWMECNYLYTAPSLEIIPRAIGLVTRWLPV